MKLGIMQPYFFPYLGYFDLINRTDRWIVFDIVKYSAKSWMNRNRILDGRGAWQYISLPVDKHCADGLIKDVRILDKDAACKRILGQINHYRSVRAPRFTPVKQLIEACFAIDSDKLVDLNVRGMELVCETLGIQFDYQIMSQMDMALPEILHPGQWALEISDQLGADEYINPPNGRPIFVPEEFEAREIKLTFTDLIDFKYHCGPYPFIEHLSILDALMWNDPEQVKSFLDSLLPEPPT